MSENGNKQTFPGSEVWTWSGLTKREYFAGLAMQGMLAGGYKGMKGDLETIAVKYADALLAKLESK